MSDGRYDELVTLTERAATLAEAGKAEAALAVVAERAALQAALPAAAPAAAAGALTRALAAERRLAAALAAAAADVARRIATVPAARSYGPAAGLERPAALDRLG